VTSAQRTLLIGTSIAMVIEIIGIVLQMAAGIGLIVLGVVIDLAAIFRFRADNR
jgi:hypothetical protein